MQVPVYNETFLQRTKFRSVAVPLQTSVTVDCYLMFIKNLRNFTQG
jgi:hypothetical protein